MISKLFILLFSFFTFSNLSAEENPYSKLEFNYKTAIQVRAGGEVDFEIKLNLPQKSFLYLKHINSNAIGIVTSFQISEQSGFQLLEISRPIGIKKNDEMILRDKGVFSFKIFDLGMLKVGTKIKVPMNIRTQICEERENEICYPPKTILKEIEFEIKEDKKIISYRSLDTISWETNFKSATEKAKSANLNIFALISEPSWCGACRFMEKEAFAKPEVQKLLKEKFIAWKVSNSEYGKVPTGSSFGIPMYFVLDSTGKSLAKWTGGRDAKSLLPLLSPYEKKSPFLDPNPAPILPEVNQSQLEVNSVDGSKCLILYGKNYPWISKKANDFHNNGTFRFGLNNQEIKVKQFAREETISLPSKVKLRPNGFQIEKIFPKETWIAECKNSSFSGKIEGTEIEFTIEK